ncbi:MAG: sugar phosphate isomerase/epimerase [Treponema sp.]|jgi:sugar phosphate isomerase/epimerase|nr:sugar phosphate isomerase/epimerase [Treponema sp.]
MAWTNKFAVFTKPWKDDALEALADRIAGFGFQGIELPVRDGYQINPENYRETLSKAVAVLGEKNVSIESVAGAIDEDLIKAMGQKGIKILRVMLSADPKKNYLEQEEAYYRRFSGLLPVLEESGVTLGVQNHFGNFLGCSAAGLMRFVSRFPVESVGAVLDLAHCAICGEITEFALDIAASHLIMVNIKSGYRHRINYAVAAEAEWKTVWTSGRHGALSWKHAAEELRKRNYSGPICLTAEYSGADKPLEGEDAYALIKEDLAYWKSLG